MKTTLRTLVGIVFVCGLPLGAIGQPRPAATDTGQVTITYLGNEGVMITDKEKSVLVDTLFRGANFGYAGVQPSELEKLETAQAPYDRIDLVLVTHVHPDHFNAESVVRHLEHNKTAVLVTSEQVAEKVRKAAGDSSALLPRIKVHTPAEGGRETVEANGIKIDVLRLSHGSGRFAGVDDLGFIIHVGGKRILHVGDAQVDAPSFKPLEAFAKGVDVACLPNWIVESPKGARLVREVLKPKKLIVFHIMPRDAKRVVQTVKSNFPDAVLFTERLKQVTVE